MRWRERLLFEAGASGRPAVLVDGDGAVATSPVEMLLVAAATCSASDVVLILEKQRVALRRLEVAVGVRLAATGQSVLRPGERSGVGPYGGLGLAFVGSGGARGASYLTALLGVDKGPGGRGGWYAELGLGGGVRLAMGRRFRRFPSWWPH